MTKPSICIQNYRLAAKYREYQVQFRQLEAILGNTIQYVDEKQQVVARSLFYARDLLSGIPRYREYSDQRREYPRSLFNAIQQLSRGSDMLSVQLCKLELAHLVLRDYLDISLIDNDDKKLERRFDQIREKQLIFQNEQQRVNEALSLMESLYEALMQIMKPQSRPVTERPSLPSTTSFSLWSTSHTSLPPLPQLQFDERVNQSGSSARNNGIW